VPRRSDPPSEDAAELRDIRGPSAFGGSFRRFLDLLWLMSLTEFRTRYVGSSLGYAWTLLRPLVFFGVIFIVLRGLIGFGARTPHYAALLVLNIILFQYFSDVTNRAVRSVSARENMVRKMQFPRIVIPLSVSLTGGFTLVLNLIAGLGLIVLTGVVPRSTWLLLPVVVLLLALLTTGVSLILSVLFVRAEDVAEVWSLISRMLFYLSPVLYPIELVPQALRPIVSINPLAPLLVEARHWVIDPSAPSAIEAAGGVAGLAVPAALFVFACVFGLWLFEREAPRVAEAV
jgi:ABC-2 type transport system permease protein